MAKKAAETVLAELEAKRDQQYAIVFLPWRRKWKNLSVYFRYPANIRKVIYTINAIKSVHRLVKAET